jgi:hypothetical protein
VYQPEVARQSRVALVLLTLLLVGTLVVCLCSGCARYPMRVAVRRLSDGHRVSVAFREASGLYPISDTSDHWPEMVRGYGPCWKVVNFTDFVFLIDIDFPMEAGASEDSVLISFDQFYGRVDAVVKVYVVEESAPTANTTVPWQITEVPIEIEIPREGRVVVAPTAGEFPQNSRIVLALDLGSGITEASTPPSMYRGGYFARVFVRVT